MSDAPELFAHVPGCPHCAAWVADPKSGSYGKVCRDCKARAIARSPGMWRALRGESNVEVREAILRNFGPDNLKAARELCHAWVEKLKGASK